MVNPLVTLWSTPINIIEIASVYLKHNIAERIRLHYIAKRAPMSKRHVGHNSFSLARITRMFPGLPIRANLLIWSIRGLRFRSNCS